MQNLFNYFKKYDKDLNLNKYFNKTRCKILLNSTDLYKNY